MKKIIVIVLILMNVVSVNASSNIPKYKIVGKTLKGELKVSYCTSSKEIKKKSFFAELFS